MGDTYPTWTDRESAIVMEHYRDEGVEGCVKALRKEGYRRTGSAVKVQARKLGVKRDRTKMNRRVPDNLWEPEETEILKESYPSGGASLTRRRLADAGYDRTIGAINVRASLMGIKSENPKRRGRGDTKLMNICLDTELDSDVISMLDGQRNRSEYLRNLVRKDINSRK